MIFSFRKKRKCVRDYDRKILRPVIRVSICTGVEVAGFRNVETGKFQDIQLIKSHGDLEDFMAEYGLKEIPAKEY